VRSIYRTSNIVVLSVGRSLFLALGYTSMISFVVASARGMTSEGETKRLGREPMTTTMKGIDKK
jgi:hypothetical protein